MGDAQTPVGPMTAAISIQNLTHGYVEAGRTKNVLNNITIEIEEQRVIALLGQSGSGKSTLLNLISGLETLQSGEIRVYGQPLSSYTDRQRTLLRRKRIGFIYQSFNLIPTLTVAENVTLPLALNRIPAEEQSIAVRKILSDLSLTEKHHQFPDRLSGGEQQRVAIARAIIHTPDLILADEPTGNLDANTGQQVLDILLHLAKDTGRTLLLVTHSQAVASQAELTYTLADGALLQGDTTSAW